MSETASQPRFGIKRIYVKDISFESPQAPTVFNAQWQPNVHLDLNTRSERVADDNFEVVLTLTIKASQDDATAFIVEMQQAGVFEISGLPDDQLRATLATVCPNLLFPYARETVDSLVLKGSFPPLMLAPVNFDVLYAQALQKQQEEAGSASPAGDDASLH